jgi:hypothetical protein
VVWIVAAVGRNGVPALVALVQLASAGALKWAQDQASSCVRMGPIQTGLQKTEGRSQVFVGSCVFPITS